MSEKPADPNKDLLTFLKQQRDILKDFNQGGIPVRGKAQNYEEKAQSYDEKAQNAQVLAGHGIFSEFENSTEILGRSTSDDATRSRLTAVSKKLEHLSREEAKQDENLRETNTETEEVKQVKNDLYRSLGTCQSL